MKQVLVKGGKVQIEEVPAPAPGPGQAVVRVRYSLISSGTESGFVAEGGTAGYVMKKARDPLNVEKVKRKLATVGLKGTIDVIKSKLFEFQAPGYSTAGVIVECGADVPGFRVGDRVACSGVNYASHAEYNAVPHQLLTPIPDGVEFDEASFVTLGAIAMQGLRQAEPQFGETFVVSGLGLIGLLAVQMARAAGCRVIGCDPLEAKRALATELGAEAVCAPEDLTDTVVEWTAGYGADAVVICAASKSSAVANQAIDVCRQKGRVVVVGAVGMQLQREAMYLKEVDFRISCSYGPGRYNAHYEERGLDFPYGYVRWTEGRNMAEFLRMVADGKVQLKPLISMVRDVDAAAEAYDAVTAGREDLVAALIRYAADEEAEAPKRTYTLKKRASKKGVGVAVIGAGSFAMGQHLPNVQAIKGARLEAVVARTGSKARQAAERFGARTCGTDYDAILKDDNVDAVVIATRHNLHHEMCLAAIAAGKHVFVEKPLALTVEHCEEICGAAERAGVLVTVGFNRRFSVFAQAAKASLDDVRGPKTILYRCNAGALPQGHWAADPVEGGGRILGEAVHFFDFACWLAGGDPVSVKASRIDSADAGTDPARGLKQAAPVIDADNLSTTLRFPDGSLATILYTCLGNSSMGKERVEVFAGGGGLVLDDYKHIAFHGLPGKDQKQATEDKGQRASLAHFIDAVQGKADLGISGYDGLRATRIALEALADAAR